MLLQSLKRFEGIVETGLLHVAPRLIVLVDELLTTQDKTQPHHQALLIERLGHEGLEVGVGGPLEGGVGGQDVSHGRQQRPLVDTAPSAAPVTHL